MSRSSIIEYADILNNVSVLPNNSEASFQINDLETNNLGIVSDTNYDISFLCINKNIMYTIDDDGIVRKYVRSI